MKSVKAAKFGHSVTLCNSEHTFITKEITRYKDVKMAWDKDQQVLVIEMKLRGKVDRAIVPMANIAQLVFDESVSEAANSGTTKAKGGRPRKEQEA